MRILVIDNYDSFTYNLVHDLGRVDSAIEITVIRNDDDLSEPLNSYHAVVISPGPGLPEESGKTLAYLAELKTNRIPVLGVCLGLQAMVISTGGKLYNLESVKHGVPGKIQCIPCPLYANLKAEMEVGLYHSWAADSASLPSAWTLTAKTSDGVIMSIEHTQLPWSAVQYHPESVLTPDGREILSNWIKAVLDDGSART